ncbi:GFA family protein [Sphingomonas sp. PB2P12]|uniref:GFA family protein n=1 Tax=Sphingomonas sandaracina TaxID=3096157 RepID=UPI002FC89FA2
MIEASCHCGAVTLTVDLPPQWVADCNCSICRRYGVLWAYYQLSDVRVAASVPTAIYSWGAKTLRFHRCGECGCVTHRTKVDPAIDRIGVNARLMPLEILAVTRIRRLDGADTGLYLDA